MIACGVLNRSSSCSLMKFFVLLIKFLNDDDFAIIIKTKENFDDYCIYNFVKLSYILLFNGRSYRSNLFISESRLKKIKFPTFLCFSKNNIVFLKFNYFFAQLTYLFIAQEIWNWLAPTICYNNFVPAHHTYRTKLYCLRSFFIYTVFSAC